MNIEAREEELIKIMKWIAEHPNVLESVLNAEEYTTAEKCLEIIEALEGKSLEYLIPILLHTTKCDHVTGTAISRIHAECMAKVWKEKGTENMLSEIKDKIRENARLKS